jgi:glutamate synthase (NADPH/NADH) large chain
MNPQSKTLHQKIARYTQEYHIDSEKGSCAIIANVKKNSVPSHGNVKHTLEALDTMQHRTGTIENEGDGCGIQTDIPRKIWEQVLSHHEIRSDVAYNESFLVGHLIIRAAKHDVKPIVRRILNIFKAHKFTIVLHRPADVRSEALGKFAKASEPVFYQIAAMPSDFQKLDDMVVFKVQLQIEAEFPNVQVSSLSNNSAVYKVRGDVKTLRNYFPELRNPDFRSAITLGHGRFSTNTDPIVERAQMFSTLGHNGEINTISRLRHEAELLGFQLTHKGSDSQDLDRIVESFMFKHGFTLMETIAILFPSVWSEIEQLPKDMQEMYTFYRRAFGSLAQGPAALICRQGDEVVFSCDAMGLRPLWVGETQEDYFASSEKGVVEFESMVCDPIPLAPGEKRGFLLNRQKFDFDRQSMQSGSVKVFSMEEIQSLTLARFAKQFNPSKVNQNLFTPEDFRKPADSVPAVQDASDESDQWDKDMTERLANDMADQMQAGVDKLVQSVLSPEHDEPTTQKLETVKVKPVVKKDNLYAAYGWTKDDQDDLAKMAESGKEVMGSMGYDGQLAAFCTEPKNLSEYFKETVAVVTNPAIDGIREHAHFSTRCFLGRKPDLADEKTVKHSPQLWVSLPILFSLPDERRLHASHTGHDAAAIKELSTHLRTFVIDDLLANYNSKHPSCSVVKTTYAPDLTLQQALHALCDEVERQIKIEKTSIIILDDEVAYEDGQLVIDAALAIATVNTHLENAFVEGKNLRRQVSLIIKSGMIRNVHDMMILLGLGANAVVPYLITESVLTLKQTEAEKVEALKKAYQAIASGIEKVISTMGIHEIEGYGKIFASIGLSKELQDIFNTRAYLGSESRGKTLASLDSDARERQAIAQNKQSIKPKRENRFNNKLWKIVGEVAGGEQPYQTYKEKFNEMKAELPVSVRHILDFKQTQRPSPTPKDQVVIRVGDHGTPIYISAMSFGSQGETAFRAYAEAAFRKNTICINGEGGEIEDMMGKYYNNRGQQIASARFGVNAKMLNSSKFLEIKVGQGAKPGEGGHLSAFKVNEKIASARHVSQGIDLISPANNHDIYSIEDLTQLIEELKTINPDARVSVKIPAIPLVAPIVTGIAKAGADIITISGYDGGTGAARKHSLKFVGFPVEIAVKEAHFALLRSGLRERVELWADGGMKTGEDVVKMIMLGANRVGFGTFAMLAIGCTQCRKCNTGTCHVGITSHFTSVEDAHAAGQKIFEARDYEHSVDGIVRLFSAFEDEIRQLVFELGFSNINQLVGRSDLLAQTRFKDQIDLDSITDFLEPEDKLVLDESVVLVKRPLTFLTRMLSKSVMESIEPDKTETVRYLDEEVSNMDRAIGTHLSGELIRSDKKTLGRFKVGALELGRGIIPGNGLGAFNSQMVHIRVEGGSQDGMAKSACGGKVIVLKGKNHDGHLIDGSVGKYFAYGALKGLLVVQGNADSRACIRLSGADVIIGGEVTVPLNDARGNIATRANIKGFAFEYMTAGRALVMGDPGPWLCSGMTGGVVYFRLNEVMNLTIEALQRRLANNSTAKIKPVDAADEQNIKELLASYAAELKSVGNAELASKAMSLSKQWLLNFAKAAV